LGRDGLIPSCFFNKAIDIMNVNSETPFLRRGTIWKNMSAQYVGMCMTLQRETLMAELNREQLSKIFLKIGCVPFVL
jgi:hypothetical protein